MVIATRNRLPSLLATLTHLLALPERPAIVVVDNGSSDGTAAAVGRHHANVRVIALPANQGCGARTIGAAQVDAPYVAFSDDDSWWPPGALARAADLLDTYPRLALVAARILVGPEERLDPTCAEMAASPLTADGDLPGPPILGFIACGAVVRRSAFLDVGGFDARFGIGGEEELLAIDLAAAGWLLVYVEEIVAYHHPSPMRDPGARRRTLARNALWSAWLRRPLGTALGRTVSLLRSARRDPNVRRGFLEAVAGLPWVVRQRWVVPSALESSLRTLEARPFRR